MYGGNLRVKLFTLHYLYMYVFGIRALFHKLFDAYIIIRVQNLISKLVNSAAVKWDLSVKVENTYGGGNYIN